MSVYVLFKYIWDVYERLGNKEEFLFIYFVLFKYFFLLFLWVNEEILILKVRKVEIK